VCLSLKLLVLVHKLDFFIPLLILPSATKIFPKVSPIVVFTERNDFALVPGLWNQWFWCDFDSKFGVFWADSGGLDFRWLKMQN